jgi:hypothetical protein
MAVKKIVGWGKCSAKETPVSGTAVTYSDIKDGSASLSVEEGSVEEALIEGGEAEAIKSNADKYIVEYDRRIGDSAQVTPGFVENAGNIEIIPPAAGAVGIKLTGVCRKITLKFDSKDGLVAHYWYKTGGTTDSNGNITDVTPVVSGGTYTAVDSSGTGYSTKNPKIEGWYIKNGLVYQLAMDESIVADRVYYKYTPAVQS